MSSKQTKVSSRRARRRRVQGSKATASDAKIMSALKLAGQINARSKRRVRNKKGISIVSDRKARGASYVQTAIAGIGASLTHQFDYYHFDTRGTSGVRCSGISPIAYAGWTSGSIFGFQQFTGTPTATLPVNPRYLFPSGSNEINLMSTMTRFRFTKCKLLYVSHVNTGVVGNLMFGYYPDGAVISSDLSPSFMLAQPGTITSQVWCSNVGTDVSQFLPKTDWFYIDTDTATDSGLRLSEQGDLTCIWGIVPVSVQTYGLFYIDYDVELIEPRTNVDLALSSLTISEALDYRVYLREKRKRAVEEYKLWKQGEDKRKMDDSLDKKSSVESGDDPVLKSQSFPDGTSVTYQLQPLSVVGQESSNPTVISNDPEGKSSA